MEPVDGRFEAESKSENPARKANENKCKPRLEAERSKYNGHSVALKPKEPLGLLQPLWSARSWADQLAAANVHKANGGEPLT